MTTNNKEQIDYWNGVAGEQWAKEDRQMARLLDPVSSELLKRSELASARNILNVGCGGGSDTQRLLESVSTEATVTGIDISAPLLAVAREKLEGNPDLATRVRYQLADASSEPFDGADFDLVFSRFGVMFFDDPVAAFSHIREHCKADASLLFSCWQSAKINEWITVPFRAALSLLDAPEPTQPRAPGPFAFAEHEYVREILASSGWRDISIEPVDVVLQWGESSDLFSNARELLKTGPVGRLLIGVDEERRHRVFEAVTEALRPYAKDGVIELSGAIWVVSATNSGSIL